MTEVRFYRSASGGEPVREHLRSLEREQRRRAGYAIRLIQLHGLQHPLLDLKCVRGKLWEIRASWQRIFYVVAPGGVVWLLHAYEKDTQRAPEDEIEVALARMRDVLA